MGPEPNGWLGGLICLVGIFLTSFFLAIGPLHLWNWFRQHPAMRSVLKGVNAAVVARGALLPGLDDRDSRLHDFVLGIIAFLLLTLWSVPPWLVVILGAVVASVTAVIV
jgi:chromate transporter